jgi:hypothetical protein
MKSVTVIFLVLYYNFRGLVGLLVSVMMNSDRSAVPFVWRCPDGCHQLDMFCVETTLF